MFHMILIFVFILLMIMGYMMILLLRSKQKIFNQKQKIQQLEIINQTITKTDDKMKESFKSISNDILQKNIDAFFKIANNTFENAEKNYKNNHIKNQETLKSFISPLKDSLTSLDSKILDIEKQRISHKESLLEQIKGLSDSNINLKKETEKLANILHSPKIRGMWGEMQLKTALKLSGMMEYSNYNEQVSIKNNKLRPDIIVKIPNGTEVVIDAKVPLTAYLNAIGSDSGDIREKHKKEHLKFIKSHIKTLSQKQYHTEILKSPEFVIMFLPSESFLSSALEIDPALTEYASNQNVVLATPINLISLLKMAYYGFQGISISDNIYMVHAKVKELSKHVNEMIDQISKLGGYIKKSSDSYDKISQSFKSKIITVVNEISKTKISNDNIKKTNILDTKQNP